MDDDLIGDVLDDINSDDILPLDEGYASGQLPSPLAAEASQPTTQTPEGDGTAAVLGAFLQFSYESLQPDSSLTTEHAHPADGVFSLQPERFLSNHYPAAPFGHLQQQSQKSLPSQINPVPAFDEAQCQLLRTQDGYAHNAHGLGQQTAQQPLELYPVGLSVQQLTQQHHAVQQPQVLREHQWFHQQQALPAALGGPAAGAALEDNTPPVHRSAGDLHILTAFAQKMGLQAADKQSDAVVLRIGELLHGTCHMTTEEQRGLVRRLLPGLAPHDPALALQTSWPPDVTGSQQVAFLAEGSVKGKCNLGSLESGRSLVNIPGAEGVYLGAHYGKRCTMGHTYKSDCNRLGHPCDLVTKYCLLYDRLIDSQRGNKVRVKTQSSKVVEKWIPDVPRAVLYHIKRRIVPSAASGAAAAKVTTTAASTRARSASGSIIISGQMNGTIVISSSGVASAQPGSSGTGIHGFVPCACAAMGPGTATGAGMAIGVHMPTGDGAATRDDGTTNEALLQLTGARSHGGGGRIIHSSNSANHGTTAGTVGEHTLLSESLENQVTYRPCGGSGGGQHKRFRNEVEGPGSVPSLEEDPYAATVFRRQIQEPWVEKLIEIVQFLRTSPSPRGFLQLLNRLKAMPEELQEMWCPGEGQRLAHLLLTPPGLLLRADRVASPAQNPDEVIAEDEAMQLIQAFLYYLQQQLGGSQTDAADMWSDMLSQVDVRHSENAVHVAARHGHRLKLLQNYVLPYTSGFALLQPTHRNYIPMHAAYRFTRDKAGYLLLKRLVQLLNTLEPYVSRIQGRRGTFHDLRQKFVYTLSNKYFTGQNSEAAGYKAPPGASGSELLKAHCQRLLLENGVVSTGAAATGPALPFPVPEPRNRTLTRVELCRLQGVASMVEGRGWRLL